jgi:hypothetical protein
MTDAALLSDLPERRIFILEKMRAGYRARGKARAPHYPEIPAPFISPDDAIRNFVPESAYDLVGL